ncbi:MAG: hypothetical protein SV429_09535 [Pseudomonadota bacterium]|nr:hypothetical protein [Pseudomonadota bacterium]
MCAQELIQEVTIGAMDFDAIKPRGFGIGGRLKAKNIDSVYQYF